MERPTFPGRTARGQLAQLASKHSDDRPQSVWGRTHWKHGCPRQGSNLRPEV